MIKNTRHKNQQGTRNLSGCKIGMKFLDSAFVKKCVALRTFYGNQGACGMFSGSPNCFRIPEVTPLVIMERSISIGSRARSRAVLMMVMASATFTLPRAVMFLDAFQKFFNLMAGEIHAEFKRIVGLK